MYIHINICEYMYESVICFHVVEFPLVEDTTFFNLWVLTTS